MSLLTVYCISDAQFRTHFVGEKVNFLTELKYTTSTVLQAVQKAAPDELVELQKFRLLVCLFYVC